VRDSPKLRPRLTAAYLFSLGGNWIVTRLQ